MYYKYRLEMTLLQIVIITFVFIQYVFADMNIGQKTLGKLDDPIFDNYPNHDWKILEGLDPISDTIYCLSKSYSLSITPENNRIVIRQEITPSLLTELKSFSKPICFRYYIKGGSNVKARALIKSDYYTYRYDRRIRKRRRGRPGFTTQNMFSIKKTKVYHCHNISSTEWTNLNDSPLKDAWIPIIAYGSIPSTTYLSYVYIEIEYTNNDDTPCYIDNASISVIETINKKDPFGEAYLAVELNQIVDKTGEHKANLSLTLVGRGNDNYKINTSEIKIERLPHNQNGGVDINKVSERNNVGRIIDPAKERKDRRDICNIIAIPNKAIELFPYVGVPIAKFNESLMKLYIKAGCIFDSKAEKSVDDDYFTKIRWHYGKEFINRKNIPSQVVCSNDDIDWLFSVVYGEPNYSLKITAYITWGTPLKMYPSKNYGDKWISEKVGKTKLEYFINAF